MTFQFKSYAGFPREERLALMHMQVALSTLLDKDRHRTAPPAPRTIKIGPGHYRTTALDGVEYDIIKNRFRQKGRKRWEIDWDVRDEEGTLHRREATKADALAEMEDNDYFPEEDRTRDA